jgi:hypothetical protein
LPQGSGHTAFDSQVDVWYSWFSLIQEGLAGSHTEAKETAVKQQTDIEGCVANRSASNREKLK